MEQSRITNTTIVALIIGLIIGFAGGAYWYKGKMTRSVDSNADTKMTETTESSMKDDQAMTKDEGAMTKPLDTIKPLTTIVSTVADNNLITSSNQKAGSTVLVNKVVSNAVVWVAVREDNSGLMGNILGAKKVGAGTTENVVVELLRPTVSNAKYYVVLYKDNGDGIFDSKVDILVESGGSILVSMFKTQ